MARFVCSILFAVAVGAALAPEATRSRWRREGGYFSRPLLANPQFRKVFLAKTKDIVERIYTEETYFRLIDEMAARLKDDAALRAKLRGDSPEAGHQLLARDVDLLKQHLTKRRQFLLEQKNCRAPMARRSPEPDETKLPASGRGIGSGWNRRRPIPQDDHVKLACADTYDKGRHTACAPSWVVGGWKMTFYFSLNS